MHQVKPNSSTVLIVFFGMPAGPNALRFLAFFIALQTSSFKISGHDDGSSNLKGFESLLHGSSYSSFVYCNQRSLTSLFSMSNVPFLSFIKHVLQEYRFFPEMSLIRLCASAGLITILSSISSHFPSRYSAYASLHFFLLFVNIGNLFFLLRFYIFCKTGLLFHLLSILCVAFHPLVSGCFLSMLC